MGIGYTCRVMSREEKTELGGRVAIVTGASRGIGRAIALAVAGEGAAVALVARSAGGLEEVRAEIEAGGGMAGVFPADMAEESDIRELVGAVVEQYGRLDIVINNAAIVRLNSLAETGTEEWDEIMAVNARGPFILCREAMPHLKKQDRSFIINIASKYALRPGEGQGSYTASKHALLGLTRTLAREAAPDGVRVHIVYPGGTDTGMRFDEDRSGLIRPEAVAEAVVFLMTLGDSCCVDEIRVRRQGTVPFE